MAKDTENIEQMNLYQKLAKIRKQVEFIQKNKSGYGYQYVSEDEILAKISVFMDKYGLLLTPGIVPESSSASPYTYHKTKVAKNGAPYEETVNEVLISGDMRWTWIDVNHPEQRETVDWFFVGQQSDASQAFGSGLTYASRYFLLKYFNVATSADDPDAFRSKQKQAEQEADREVTEEILHQVDTHVKAVVEGDAKKKDAVLKLVQKYVKNGNYLAIKEASLAAKLLQEVRDTFPMGVADEHD